MRNNVRYICTTTFSIILIVFFCLFFTSCDASTTQDTQTATTPQSSPGTQATPAVQATPSSQSVLVDWSNIMHFGGITYLATTQSNRLTQGNLGSLYGTVKVRLAGIPTDANYQLKDGDAALLYPGTPIYSVNGYQPWFRLAALVNNGIFLYESNNNANAKKGADLLDIGGKVQYIGIVSGQDQTTELGTIKDAQQVATLVSMVLAAPVNQQNPNYGNTSYNIVFHLLDGTVTSRPYWIDTNFMDTGIRLPKAFSDMIQKALK